MPGYRIARSLAIVLVTLGALVVPSSAAVIVGDNHADLLIGLDDDNLDNPTIHPPGTAANQSLNNTDVLLGEGGNDVVIGLLGSDVMHGGSGDDILIGGPEGGVAPNSDVIFGDDGKDINIWAPGDGSDAFIGGPHEDALVIGLIDRDPNDPAGRLPLLSNPVPRFPHGVPGVNISGTSGTCTLERVTDPDLGFEFLVRFFGGNGALAVTIRLSEVEQVFCPDGQGGIVFADLTVREPEFTLVASDRLVRLNRNVALISR
jgi:hypothetical protein